MKSFTLSLVCVALLFTGCNKPQPADLTILGWWSPYYFMPEQLNGKVKMVTEQNYWTTLDKGRYIKGVPITTAWKVKIGWTPDFRINFNEQGQLVKCDYLAETGAAWGSWNITYDNELPTLATYQENDSLKITAVIKTDETKNITETQNYAGSSKTLLSRNVWIYSEKDRFIKTLFYNSLDQLTKNYRYTWDKNSRITEVESYSGEDSLKGKYLIDYNKYGFSKKQQRLTATGTTIKSVSVTYEYDEHLNWTKAVYIENGKPIVIAERYYEYYTNGSSQAK